MNVKDKVAVVTGGVSGIGLALCTRFAQEGAHVVLSDLNQEACERHAAPIGALPVAADVAREEDIKNLVASTVGHFGRIDLFVSNAGIAIDGGIDTPTDKWQKIIGVNLMSEVFAAKYAIPHMLEQGSGYLLNVASAAGLLVIFDTVSYTVTKHAAIGFTEWLAATYDDQGIGVSVLCPAAVRTPILAGKDDTPRSLDRRTRGIARPEATNSTRYPAATGHSARFVRFLSLLLQPQ
jgi:NAD(P)-dependent dehydrogenase (short-subunit alcohol dehydrogenase family)